MKLYAVKAPWPGIKGYIRDMRPMWYLEEVEAKYDLHMFQSPDEMKADWYLAKSPFGRVPALEDGAQTIFESGAVVTYLADKYKRLIPAIGTKERLAHDQWMFATVTNFEFNASRVLACDVIFDKGADTDAKRANAIENLEGFFPGLERHLAKSAYLTGQDFQVCDLMLTSILRHGTTAGYLKSYPAITAYLAKNTTRPAFLRAYEKNGG